MTVKQTVWFVCGVVAIGAGCRSKRQYSNEQTPGPGERTTVALVAEDTSPSVGGDASPDSGSSSGSSISDITAKIAERDAEPVIWGQSAGGIVLGQTEWNDWVFEFNEDYNSAAITPAARGDRPNYKNVDGELVASTIRSVLITSGYKGPFEFPMVGGGFKTMRMREKFTDLGFFSGDGEIYQADRATESTLGREFFKNFYRVTYGDENTLSDYDCFLSGHCQYFVTNEGFAVEFTPDNGDYGYIYLSSQEGDTKYSFLQAYFSKPDVKKPGQLSGQRFDVMAGAFSGSNVNETLMSREQSYADVMAAIDLAESSAWYSTNTSVVGSYLGLDIYYRKTDEDSLASEVYGRPRDFDTVSGVWFDRNYKGEIYLTGGSEPLGLGLEDTLKVELNGQPYGGGRERWSRYQFIEEFSEISSYVKGLKEQGYQIYRDLMVNVGSTELRSSYRYENLFRAPSGQFTELTIYGRQGNADYGVKVMFLPKYEVAELQYSSAIFVDAEQGPEKPVIGRTLGSHSVGDGIMMKDLDVEDEEASLMLPDGRWVRVDYLPESNLTTKRLIKGDIVETKVQTVPVITGLGKSLYLQASECAEEQSEQVFHCFEVIAVEFTRFYTQDFVDGLTEQPVIAVCQSLDANINGDLELNFAGEIHIGSKINDFVSMAEKSTCLLTSDESEISSSNKTLYYIPADGIALTFEDDDATTLSTIVMYQ